MSLKPRDGKINIGGTDLIVADLKYMTDVHFFDRVEFSHARMREVSEVTGAKPIFISLPGGMVAQLQDGCVTSTARPITPDDNDYDKIHRRFDIKRWTIEGGSTKAALIDTVYGFSKAHKIYLNKFEALQAEAKADISIVRLTAMQTDFPVPPGYTFITATGLTITGMPLGSGSIGTISNALIVNFNPDVDYEEPLNALGTLSRVMRRWSATIEVRVEVAALSVAVPSF